MWQICKALFQCFNCLAQNIETLCFQHKVSSKIMAYPDSHYSKVAQKIVKPIFAT
jgi:hypothetical protein